jgi:hypothetical protein
MISFVASASGLCIVFFNRDKKKEEEEEELAKTFNYCQCRYRDIHILASLYNSSRVKVYE